MASGLAFIGFCPLPHSFTNVVGDTAFLASCFLHTDTAPRCFKGKECQTAAGRTGEGDVLHSHRQNDETNPPSSSVACSLVGVSLYQTAFRNFLIDVLPPLVLFSLLFRFNPTLVSLPNLN
jgi:hypothetical protein